MTKIMNGKAMPENLAEAITRYTALRTAANTAEDGDVHEALFAAMGTAFEDICDGKFPICHEADASALIDVLANEVNDAFKMQGSFVDQIVVQVQDFLKKRAALTDEATVRAMPWTRRWLLLRREIEALALPGRLADETMNTMMALSNRLANDIINEPAHGEEAVKDKLALVQDLVTDESGESMLTQRAIQATFDAIELLKVRRSKLVDVLVDLSDGRSSAPEAAEAAE